MQPSDPPTVSREELIELVARSHQDPTVPYAASVLAGRALAAQSKLPSKIAENLGAGFGQWTFFPAPAEIVEFAESYVPPVTEDDLWTMARAWASDDAAGRPTMMALVGREILQSELRRIEAPKLRELFDESRPTRARALREKLGLDVPAIRATAPTASTGPAGEPKRKAAPAAAAKAPVTTGEAPAMTKMPVARRPPAPPKPVVPPKRFAHPKFGEGALERQEGEGADAKLTIRFEAGSKTVLARFVEER